ncbi:MAG: Cof-type HAD-IIB family hydrolase [Clostridia bacterium]|nr:Cof-type HAD-IIB family hydrolase [Clostridia bacterium]
MREINYPIIVSDFDGTLLNSEHSVSDGVKKAIDEYVANGGIFAVCTGRMLCCILSNVRALGLKGYVVAHQGTVIADIESGKLIKYGGFKTEETVEICRNLEELNYPANVYAGDAMYTTIAEDDRHLLRYEGIVGLKSTHVDGIMSDFVLKNGLFCQKVAVMVAPEDQTELFAELKRRLGSKHEVTCSAAVLIEISPLGNDKGEGLKFLCEKFGVPLERSVAIGDNLNDLAMIKAAGVGVAVGNASDGLKEEADYLTVTNDEDAVAKVIEKFGFKND